MERNGQFLAFPLGGYVKMLDEREGEVAAAELPRAFTRQSVGRRAFIVAAGPAANSAAIALYWFLFHAWHNRAEATPRIATTGHSGSDGRRRRRGYCPRQWQGHRYLEQLRWEVMRQAMDKQALQLEAISPQRETAMSTF